jgi:hypothetical protein
MGKNLNKIIFVVCSVFLLVGILGTLVRADEENICIDPNMVNLNANYNTINDASKADHDIIVTLGERFSSGLITDLEVDMLIDGVVVAEAVSAHVTRFTGLVNIDFDKAEIQQYAIDNNLEGIVDVEVAGSFTHDSSGYYEFVGYGQLYFK